MSLILAIAIWYLIKHNLSGRSDVFGSEPAPKAIPVPGEN